MSLLSSVFGSKKDDNDVTDNLFSSKLILPEKLNIVPPPKQEREETDSSGIRRNSDGTVKGGKKRMREQRQKDEKIAAAKAEKILGLDTTLETMEEKESDLADVNDEKEEVGKKKSKKTKAKKEENEDVVIDDEKKIKVKKSKKKSKSVIEDTEEAPDKELEKSKKKEKKSKKSKKNKKEVEDAEEDEKKESKVSDDKSSEDEKDEVSISKTKTNESEDESSSTEESAKPSTAEPDENEDLESTKESSPKESTDDEERTVFVGNLPVSTTRKSLATMFKPCGKVVSTRIRSVAVAGVKLPEDRAGNQDLVRKICFNTQKFDKTTKQTIQGYVVFASVTSIPAALKLNNTLVKNADGKSLHIRVDTATPTVDPARSIFVGNLYFHSTEYQLRDHFKDCGKIEGVRIVRDKDTLISRGFGYILFETKESVAQALRMHETTFKKRKIRVMVCGKRFKNKKGASDKKRENAAAAALLTGAAQRVMKKGSVSVLKKKTRGKTQQPGIRAASKGGAGISKRAEKEKKEKKLVKKMQKRIDKGMGKQKK